MDLEDDAGEGPFVLGMGGRFRLTRGSPSESTSTMPLSDARQKCRTSKYSILGPSRLNHLSGSVSNARDPPPDPLPATRPTPLPYGLCVLAAVPP